jgi:hypothetical protein
VISPQTPASGTDNDHGRQWYCTQSDCTVPFALSTTYMAPTQVGDVTAMTHMSIRSDGGHRIAGNHVVPLGNST